MCTGQRRFSSDFSRYYLKSRPPTAPKQYPNIKDIGRNVDKYEKNCIARNYKSQAEFIKRIALLSQESIATSKKLAENTRVEIKNLEKDVAQRRARGETASEQLKGIAKIKRRSQQWEDLVATNDKLAHELALTLPNLTSPETPVGVDPTTLTYFNFDPSEPPAIGRHKDHSAIGAQLSVLDFSSASKATGWGFYYLMNEGALLEQALIQYATSVAVRHGFRMVSPPSLVYSHIVDACGFQPRDKSDEQQIWHIAQPEKEKSSTSSQREPPDSSQDQKSEEDQLLKAAENAKPQRSLAATAEIPLAAMYANQAIPELDLPVKLVASSRCYRAEAGARGVDTKGLYRVHEFTKVEMFAWTDCAEEGPLTDPGAMKYADHVFDEMISIQTEILASLGLPCRVLEMSTADLGASAYRKIDMEALFPSRMDRNNGWGEVTSVSICTDYQSRRLGTRIAEKCGARKKFPYTLNGTAMAVPRALAAVLEHGWREQEGVVIIPDVLRPFMGGIEKIGPK